MPSEPGQGGEPDPLRHRIGPSALHQEPAVAGGLAEPVGVGQHRGVVGEVPVVGQCPASAASVLGIVHTPFELQHLRAELHVGHGPRPELEVERGVVGHRQALGLDASLHAPHVPAVVVARGHARSPGRGASMSDCRQAGRRRPPPGPASSTAAPTSGPIGRSRPHGSRGCVRPARCGPRGAGRGRCRRCGWPACRLRGSGRCFAGRLVRPRPDRRRSGAAVHQDEVEIARA